MGGMSWTACDFHARLRIPRAAGEPLRLALQSPARSN